MRLVFRAESEAVLDEIVVFGAEKWGAEQAASYARRLLASIGQLVDNPR